MTKRYLDSEWRTQDTLENSYTERQAVRVAIIVSHPILRAGLKAVLVEENGLELISETESVNEALTDIESKEVDVVVLGVSEPLSEAIRDLDLLAQCCPDVTPVVFTNLRSVPCLTRMLMAGARAYVLIDYGKAEIIDAVMTAHRGRSIKLPTDLALGILRGLTAPNGQSEQEPISHPARLTAREKEILDQMATGERYRVIADRLCLAESTVKKYAHSVITKLGASNRATAVLKAHHLKLLSEESRHLP